MSHSLQSSASFLSISGYGQDKQPQQSGPASGPQLRPLPAYANVNVVQQPAAPQTPSSSANPFFSQTPASTKPAPKYQSRERLYYLPNLPTERPASTTIQPSTITKPTSAGIGDSTKEEPPTTSLYDDPLSPEHRHILERPQAAFEPSRPLHELLGPSALSPIPTAMLIDEGFGLQRSPIISMVSAAASTVPLPTGQHPLDNWVTVFGFSGPHTASVLAYFKSLGPVVFSELGQRNWLHIQYENLISAQKALLKNGSILPAAGSCMIGVLPTKNAVDQVGQASTSFMSPLKKGIELSNFPATKPASGSPLIQATMPSEAVSATPGFPQESLYAHSRLPQVSQERRSIESDIFAQAPATHPTISGHSDGGEGFLTKAFNYIFGF